MLIDEKGPCRDDTALLYSTAENTLLVLPLHDFAAALIISSITVYFIFLHLYLFIPEYSALFFLSFNSLILRI